MKKKKRPTRAPAPSIIAEVQTATEGEYPKSRGRLSHHPKWGRVRLIGSKLYSERNGESSIGVIAWREDQMVPERAFDV